MTDADIARLRTWAEELVRVKYADEVARLVLDTLIELAAAEARIDALEAAAKKTARGCACDYDHRCWMCDAVLDLHTVLATAWR